MVDNALVLAKRLALEEGSAQDLGSVSSNKLALKFFKNFGLPYRSISPFDVVWTGRHLRSKGIKGANLIHEIAHFLVAPKEMRALPDYGLGTSPDSRPKKGFKTAIRSIKDQSLEEGEASLLGILIERQIGMNWTLTFKEHSWSHLGSWKPLRPIEEVLSILIEKRLIDRHGNLTVLSYDEAR